MTTCHSERSEGPGGWAVSMNRAARRPASLATLGMTAMIGALLTVGTAAGSCPPLKPHFVEHASRHYTGLRSAPSFFVRDRCNDGYPTVDVFDGPELTRRIAQLRWQRGSAQADGSEWWCSAVVHPALDDGSLADCARDELPVMEYTYEEPGFIVLEQTATSARIRLDQGDGWIRKEQGGDFYPYEDLVEALPQLSKAWNGLLYRTPGGKSKKPAGQSDGSLQILDSRVVNGALWFKVRLLDHSPCTDREPDGVDSGWIPAYNADGDPTVNYSPRGC
jgi:hypothetical protein